MENTIKLELDTISNAEDPKAEINLGHDLLQDQFVSNKLNAFQNVILKVKQESTVPSENTEINTDINTDIEQKTEVKSHGEQIEVKIELQNDEEIVSYDYPNLNNTALDNIEATILGNVKMCLQEEFNIKVENNCNDVEKQKDETCQDVKIEPGLTITETHLTLERISVSATNKDEEDGSHLVKMESQLNGTIKTYDSDANSMFHNDFIDTYDINVKMEQQMIEQDNVTEKEHFQLNSITGNIMSLEQEAMTSRLKSQKIHLCPKCPKKYAGKNGLRRHLKVHSKLDSINRLKNERKKKRLQAKMQIKKKPLHYEYVMDDGMSSRDEESYYCTCGKVYRRRTRMETCLRSHNSSEIKSNSQHPCLSCTQQFSNKDELNLHRKKLHRKKYPCKFCPTDYNTRKELLKHLQIHQKVQLMEYKVISEVIEGKQTLRCFMCPKTWAELSELKTHVLNEHKGPYLCPHCKNTFPKIIDYGNHIKTYHPEVEGQSVWNVIEAFSLLVKAWKCEECELQFLEADKLALHQLEMHSPEVKAEQQFQCTDCRRVFVSQKGLTSHRRIHHSAGASEETPEIVQGIMCLECRKMCKDMTALTSHMRLHSPDRKYPCKFCDFRFATPEKRKSHSEIHTGDMKYVCFICEYQCSSEDRLKRHKTTLKHNNMKEYLLTGKPLIEESTSKEVDTDLNFKRRKKDKDASGEESDSDSEVPCDICGDKFPNEKAMVEHKQTHPFIEFPNDDKPSRIFFK